MCVVFERTGSRHKLREAFHVPNVPASTSEPTGQKVLCRLVLKGSEWLWVWTIA